MTSRFILSLFAAVFSATLFTAAPTTAQSSMGVSRDERVLGKESGRIAPDSVVDSLARVGPRTLNGVLRVARNDSTRTAPVQRSDAHLGAGSNVALMGVGLAGIVIGSLVDGSGGTMMVIGGGVVGLIGLFRYLR